MQRRYAFGGLLRLFRKNVGLTQMALAEQMGTSQRGISDWERGLYLPENREKVLKLATHLYLHSDETEQLLIAARLQQPTEGAPPTGDAKSVWSVPHQRNPFFTGREDLLELLWERLHATNAAALSQPQAMSGLGGIGKTQIALEYAYRHRISYQAVFWVRAALAETTLADMVAIATLLRLPEKDEPDQSRTLFAVKQWLATHDEWLLIFDNADHPDQVRELLPAAGHGHLILTTRAQALGGLAQPVTVQTMEIGRAHV